MDNASEVSGFGAHTSMWAMGWTREATVQAVAAAQATRIMKDAGLSREKADAAAEAFKARAMR